MGHPLPSPEFRIDDFIAWETEQHERHEYLDGEVFAMTGARDGHNTIAGNLFAHLHSTLRGSPCRAFIADMKLRVDAADAVFYPDVLVTCDARDRSPATDTAKQHPILLIEVLSEATAAYDRGLKFERYRQLETLREYLLVEQDRRHVDLFRRTDDGRWLLESHGPDGEFTLTSIDVTLSLDLIYEDVRFAAEA